MLKCRDILELADAYLANELNKWQRMQFRLHLAVCRNCRRYVRQLKLTQKVCQSLPIDQQVSEQQLDSILTLIQQSDGQK